MYNICILYANTHDICICVYIYIHIYDYICIYIYIKVIYNKQENNQKVFCWGMTTPDAASGFGTAREPAMARDPPLLSLLL